MASHVQHVRDPARHDRRRNPTTLIILMGHWRFTPPRCSTHVASDTIRVVLLEDLATVQGGSDSRSVNRVRISRRLRPAPDSTSLATAGDDLEIAASEAALDIYIAAPRAADDAVYYGAADVGAP